MSALARFLERVVADERARAFGVDDRRVGQGLLDVWDAAGEDGDGLLPHERPATAENQRLSRP